MFFAATLAAIVAAPAGMPAPTSALAFVEATEALVPATTRANAPQLAALLGEAADVEATIPGLGTVPAPLKTPLPPLSSTMALVAAAGDALVHVTFYDPKLDQRLVFTFGRRMAAPKSKDRDTFVLIETPYVERGAPKRSGSDFSAAFEKQGAKWQEVAPTPAELEKHVDGVGAPFSTCERVLRDAASSISTALLLRSVETETFTADVASLKAEVTRGVSAKITLSKDKKHYTADLLYRGAVARITDVNDQPKFVTPCAAGR